MANPAVTGRSGLTRRAAAYGLGLMTLLNFVNYIDRSVVFAVAPRIQRDFSLNDTELGLIGSAFLFSYFLVSPLFGWLGDRWRRPRLMAIGVGIWSLATAGAGVAQNLGQMLFARGSVGVGEASYASISPTLISDYYPPERRGRVFAIFYLAIPVGIAAGYLLGGALESHFGWRTAFFAVGLPGLLLALLTLTAPDPPRGINDKPAPSVGRPRSYLQTLSLLASNRDYVMAVLGYAAYTFAVGGMSFWMPKYLVSERGLDLDKANYLVGGISAVAGLGGTLLGGYLADRLAVRIRQAHLYVSSLSMVAAVPFAWIAFSSPDRTVWMSALLAAEFLVFLSTGPINVVLVTVVPVAIRASAMAVSIFFIHLCGDAAAPVVIGAVSDRVGLPTAVLIMPIVVGVSGLVWLVAAAKPALRG